MRDRTRQGAIFVYDSSIPFHEYLELRARFVDSVVRNGARYDGNADKCFTCVGKHLS